MSFDNSAGAPSFKQLTGNGLSAPVALSFTGSDNLWVHVANRMVPTGGGVLIVNSASGTLSQFALDGSSAGPPITGLGLSHPFGIAQCSDKPEMVVGWCVAGAASNKVVVVHIPHGFLSRRRCVRRVGDRCVGWVPVTPHARAQTLKGGGLDGPHHLAYDGNLSITNYGGNSVTAFDDDGRLFPGSPFRGGGLDGPEGIAIDGDRHIWVANNAAGANSVSELAAVLSPRPSPASAPRSAPHVAYPFGIPSPNAGHPISPPHGFTGTGLDRPYGIAVDRAGNVWVTNQGNDSVTVFIGAAKGRTF